MDYIKEGQGTVQSIEKALIILRSFTLIEPELGVSDLSARLNMYKGTVYKILKTLEKNKFLIQNLHNQKYRLGIKLFELGNIALCGLEIRNIALPLMRNLNLQTNETVTLNIVDQSERVCIEKIESSQVIRSFDQSVGGRNPIYLGAAGKILLAHLSSEEIESILSICQRTKTILGKAINPQVLRGQLQIIRNQGYAYAVSERSVGSAAVSAPIRDHQDRVIAGISLSGPESRFTKERLTELIHLVTLTAQQMSSRMGWEKSITTD